MKSTACSSAADDSCRPGSRSVAPICEASAQEPCHRESEDRDTGDTCRYAGRLASGADRHADDVDVLVREGGKQYALGVVRSFFLECCQRGLELLRSDALERYDLAFVATEPGRWVFHCRIGHHLTNNGESPGGLMLVIDFAA